MDNECWYQHDKVEGLFRLMSQGGKPTGYVANTLILFCDVDVSNRIQCMKHGTKDIYKSEWFDDQWPKLTGLVQRLGGQAYEIEIPASMPEVNMAVLNDLLFNKGGVQLYRLSYLFK